MVWFDVVDAVVVVLVVDLVGGVDVVAAMTAAAAVVDVAVVVAVDVIGGGVAAAARIENVVVAVAVVVVMMVKIHWLLLGSWAHAAVVAAAAVFYFEIVGCDGRDMRQGPLDHHPFVVETCPACYCYLVVGVAPFLDELAFLQGAKRQEYHQAAVVENLRVADRDRLKDHLLTNLGRRSLAFHQALDF